MSRGGDVRFVHTSDWQLGMTRHFLAGEAQARYTAGRIDAIRAIGEVARAENADMVVVAGDVFDSNLVAPATVQRALDAMASVQRPIYLLAGNHDALDAVSIYRSAAWRRYRPGNVHVLEQGLNVTESGAEIVAAPLRSNDPRADLLGRELSELRELSGRATVPRIAVGHGIVDVLDPSGSNVAAIRLEMLERALADGLVHYVALGDKHTRLAVGDTGRVHYSGASEVTSFREELPGDVLVVDVQADGAVGVRPHHVGTWAFREVEQRLLGEADVEALDRTLGAFDPKDRTVVRTRLVGTLTLREKALLEEVVQRHRHSFAALFGWARHEDIAVTMSGADVENMHVSGFVETAARELAQAASQSGEGGGSSGDPAAARDALSLLFRLAQGARQ